jgi:hypothetical protein
MACSCLRLLEDTAQAQGWSAALETEYNRINAQQYEIRKKIELQLRHLQMGAVNWSPKLQSFRNAIEIWTLLLKQR